MLQNAPVIAFLATKDAEKATVFYRDVLGLKLLADEAYALVFDAGSTMLRIQKVEEVTAVAYTSLGWQVSDIAASVKELDGAGVRFEQFPGIDQDDAGIMTFPDGAKVAWFRDPDGNLLSLTQHP